MININLIILFLCTFFLSVFGSIQYRKFAIKNNIIANINFRTLHEKPTPRGGGIIFSSVFIISVIILYLNNEINFNLLLVFSLGAFFAATVGYIDDLIGIKAPIKLLLQILMSLWLIYCFDGGLLNMIDLLNGWPSWFISLFLLTWLINTYNFIDGIDGMAISGAILILCTLSLTLIISNNITNLLILFLTLLSSCLGFLFFNWPKATIFMGDSGSIFLGYIFGALIIYSTMTGEVHFFTWLIVFGYYLADTTTTTLIRILTVKNWYHSHRSHAYQNLARVLNSHFKITIGVFIYHLF